MSYLNLHFGHPLPVTGPHFVTLEDSYAVKGTHQKIREGNTFVSMAYKTGHMRSSIQNSNRKSEASLY